MDLKRTQLSMNTQSALGKLQLFNKICHSYVKAFRRSPTTAGQYTPIQSLYRLRFFFALFVLFSTQHVLADSLCAKTLLPVAGGNGSSRIVVARELESSHLSNLNALLETTDGSSLSAFTEEELNEFWKDKQSKHSQTKGLFKNIFLGKLLRRNAVIDGVRTVDSVEVFCRSQFTFRGVSCNPGQIVKFPMRGFLEQTVEFASVGFVPESKAKNSLDKAYKSFFKSAPHGLEVKLRQSGESLKDIDAEFEVFFEKVLPNVIGEHLHRYRWDMGFHTHVIQPLPMNLFSQLDDDYPEIADEVFSVGLTLFHANLEWQNVTRIQHDQTLHVPYRIGVLEANKIQDILKTFRSMKANKRVPNLKNLLKYFFHGIRHLSDDLFSFEIRGEHSGTYFSQTGSRNTTYAYNSASNQYRNLPWERIALFVKQHSIDLELAISRLWAPPDLSKKTLHLWYQTHTHSELVFLFLEWVSEDLLNDFGDADRFLLALLITDWSKNPFFDEMESNLISSIQAKILKDLIQDENENKHIEIHRAASKFIKSIQFTLFSE